MQGLEVYRFYAIDIIVGVWMLVSGIVGLVGKTLPFVGINTYTEESLSKMARIVAVPYMIGACVSLFNVYKALQNGGNVDNGTSLFAIGVLVVVFIFHYIVLKKVAKKK